MKIKKQNGFTFVELTAVLFLILVIIIPLGIYKDSQDQKRITKGYADATAEIDQKFSSNKTTISKVTSIETIVTGGKFSRTWRVFHLENGDRINEDDIANQNVVYVKEGSYLEYADGTDTADQSNCVRAVALPNNYNPKSGK